MIEETKQVRVTCVYPKGVHTRFVGSSKDFSKVVEFGFLTDDGKALLTVDEQSFKVV